MTTATHPTKHTVETASGTISYTEMGEGPVALFVHGVLMNKHLWRHQLEGLADIRRSLAIDLMAHGATQIRPDQPVDVTANATMIAQFLDALEIDQVDLIGNDSGGGISQIFAANYPERIRSLTITNADTHDNWTPEAFKPFVEMSNNGGLSDTIHAMLNDKSIYRSAGALGPAYEDANSVTDHDIDIYLEPLVKSPQSVHDLERFLAAFDNKHTLAIEDKIGHLQAPVNIIWGDDDVYFPVKWAHWLAEELATAGEPTILPGARLFFPEERWEQFNDLLRTALTTRAYISQTHLKELNEMTEQQNRAALLRSLYTDGVLVLPNAWDAGSARIIERAGAKAIATTSGGVSWSLGSKDGQGISRSEQADAVRRIVGSVSVPVTVDVEGGYGPGPEDVAETVTAVIEAGAVGINLEDSRADGTLFTAEAQAARIAGAREAASTTGLAGLVINVRTDVILFGIGEPEGRLDEVLARGAAYAAAGADGLFVPGLLDLDLIRDLVSRSPLPINIMAGPGAPSVAELEAAGVKRVSVGTAIAEAAYKITEAAATEILTAGTYENLGAGNAYGDLNSAFNDK